MLVDVLFFGGILLIIVGLIKRRETWGKTAAWIGLAALAISVIVGWPDMAEGFREGYEAGQGGDAR